MSSIFFNELLPDNVRPRLLHTYMYAQPSCRSINFNSTPSQSRTVGTGAFDAEGPDWSEGLGPSLQIAVAGTADRDGHRPQPRAQRIDDDGSMSVFMSVDADYDLAG